LLVIIFWNIHGPLLIRGVEKGKTFDSELACELLQELEGEVCKQRPKTGANGMLLHWDNARPHVSETTQGEVKRLGFKILLHPAYSPDLAPSDFFLFGYLKGVFAGRRFTGPEDLLAQIMAEMVKIPRETFEKVYHEWIERATWVLANGGDYSRVTQATQFREK